ncbi:MAG TPA: hypothetical protein VFC97_06750 [Verrucomicrobiae bacterium]|nr:hypothetical protein [Verrucomicrobiae bacterium]
MSTRPPGMHARHPGLRALAAGRARLGALAVIVAFVLAACSAFTPTTAPSTPTDFAGVVAELENLGIDVNRVVSGEAGCDDQRLSRTAIAFDARGLDQAAVVRIHLYAFKDQPTYDALRSTIDACARSYVTDPAAFGAVDEPPYVLAGSGPWAPAFKDALRTALQRAAVGG